MLRGLAQQRSDQSQCRHDSGSHHRGFGAGKYDEEDDGSHAQPEPGPSGQSKQDRQGEHGGQDHDDVLAADHQQVAQPRSLEIPRDLRIQPRCVAQGQAQQQAALPAREEPVDGAPNERPEHLRRANEDVRRRSEAPEGPRNQLDRDALMK